ncbi:hypothetical protein BPAE_0104g00250 [Botrytis paeoniae]|uniref:Major facilitator superfamily (MFS) profile domain-containing protein n=1 Tax=Botrytis paeoniae TaxID=278948 RepID=A0A4Z1FHV7_9HELO|nr:hypothetical protein BPAE_0104g00250 [Botrytis paeoniae]
MAQATNSTSSSGSETHWFENVVVLDLDLEGQEVEKKPVVDAQSTPARITRSQSLTRLGIQQKFTHPNSHLKTTEADVVDFDGVDDPYQPLNWPFRKKLITTFVYGLFTMTSTWASSVYSPAIDQVTTEFKVAPELISYGRKAAVLTPVFISACFSFGSATAKDIQTLLLTRFFAGIFGAAPVTNTGGVLSDIWAPQSRGTAIVGYAFAVVGVQGPTMGPIVGGAITSSYLGWRWTEYITGIMQMAVLLLGALVLNETYPDALLVAKARRLRHDTGNWALHARHEERSFSFREMVNKFLMRPFRLLGTPICFLMVLYASFVYGILYLLPFLALLLGTIFGGTANILNNKFYTREFEANDNQPVPEARLPPMMIGSIFFAAGLFIFGWTSAPSIHWVAPCIGLVFMGFGFFTIFQSALNYLIDTFSSCAASAVAAQTFVRAIFAALFPLLVTPMFQGLGIDWGSSVLGFVATALIPIPFLFYVYGKRIRMKGKFTTK